MQSGPRRPIIVADDDAELCAVIEDLLTEAGFMVFLATSGDEVLDYVRQGVRPSLVICDVLMPGLPLASLLGALAENPRTSDVAIALMTGGPTGNLPPTRYVLHKPFGLSALLELAREAVEAVERERRASSAG